MRAPNEFPPPAPRPPTVGLLYGGWWECGCGETVTVNPSLLEVLPESKGPPKPFDLVVQHGPNREARITLPGIEYTEEKHQALMEWLGRLHAYEERRR